MIDFELEPTLSTMEVRRQVQRDRRTSPTKSPARTRGYRGRAAEEQQQQSAPASGMNVTRLRMQPSSELIGFRSKPYRQSPLRLPARSSPHRNEIARLHVPNRIGDFSRAVGGTVERSVNESRSTAVPQNSRGNFDQRLNENGRIEFIDVIFVQDGLIEAAE